MKTCCVPFCESPLLAKGYCRKHYLRQYRHGDFNTVKKPSEYVLKGEDAPQFKHGLWAHPLYKTWANMMRRCYSPTEHSYKNYGARGIAVCKRWHEIKNFIADIGERPKGQSLDMIDNNKGYSPENCRWASYTQQSRNRRYAKLNMQKANQIREHKKKGATRKCLAEMFNVSESTIKKVLSNAYWKT